MAEMKNVAVPDIGDYKDVSIIELMVKVGDTIAAEDTLLTLETDKAAMDVPSPFAGVIKEIKVKVGDKVSQGSLILVLESVTSTAPTTAKVDSAAPKIVATTPPVAPVSTPSPDLSQHSSAPPVVQTLTASGKKAHASPAIRRFARELGVDIAKVAGSGDKNRVTRDDVQNFVKLALAAPQVAAGGNGLQVLASPVIDFAKYGTVEVKPLSRIKKISGANLHRNWVTIPHVTQFDEADITEMEAFRKQLGEEYAKQAIKITPLVFMLKAVVKALQKFPEFNSSLDATGENLVYKNYFHIGVAVDTPDGLMVPVLRDVDSKGLVQLAKELGEISAKAREKKITAADMQGGCFSISSLGGIGGTAFTPIINAPEVAILGVSKSCMKPVYKDGEFVARLMLPLSLSYDHRVIDGALAARFTAYLAKVLSDIRLLAV
jgi:pyruvate dehydrogenase E2 component (dihydrolipoamide acetyltransferase)